MSRTHCLRKVCRNLVPNGRRKYCSDRCMQNHLYVDNRRAFLIDKICKYESCGKLFKGNGLQKYCSPACRVKHHYGVLNAVIAQVAAEPRLCICCDPPKTIIGRGKYCPENEWMKRLTHEDKQRGLDIRAELMAKKAKDQA